MISYWFPAPVSYWWPVAFTIAALVVCMVAVAATLMRRSEERNALTIAALYCVGFGLIAVSEFLMFLAAAFNLSLAKAWAISTGVVQFFAIAAAVVAVVAIVAGAVLQFQEERGYRQVHLAR